MNTASNTGSASLLAVIAIVVAGRVGLHLTADEGATAAGAVATLTAAVSHYGIIGILHRAWSGEPTR